MRTFGPAIPIPWRERFHIKIGLKEHFTGDENADKDAYQEQFTAKFWQCLLMEEESQVVADPQFKLGRISVRENSSGQLAKSDTYQSRYFSIPVAGIANIELSFKHLTGQSTRQLRRASQA